jgi:hypothetical protein
MYASLIPRTPCAIGHIPASWKGSKLDMLQAAPTTITQIEGFSWPNHKPPPEAFRRWALKDEDVVVEALSSLGSSSKQSNSGRFGLRKRWLQPLDEQTSYYLQVVKDASAPLRNPKGEPEPIRIGGIRQKPPAHRRLLNSGLSIMASHWPPVKPSSSPNSADENLISGLRDILVPVGGSFSLEFALPTETIL